MLKYLLLVAIKVRINLSYLYKIMPTTMKKSIINHKICVTINGLILCTIPYARKTSPSSIKPNHVSNDTPSTFCVAYMVNT